MIYFTSDTHYGHANVIKFCNRPFADVDEMERELIRRWNVVVGKGDTVYHLGDFGFCKYADVQRILSSLNGEKHLILGNHDGKDVERSKHWRSIRDYHELRVDGVKVILCHFAFRVWNKCHHGSINLHGHSHGSLPGTSQQCDVGVDCWSYAPVGLPEIMERLKGNPPQHMADYHGSRAHDPAAEVRR